MNCEEIRRSLRDHVDQELPAEAAASIEAHLAACQACLELARVERGLKAALCSRLRYDKARPGLASEIGRAVRAEAGALQRKRGLRRRLAAAALLLTAGLSAWAWFDGGRAAPSAMAFQAVREHQCARSLALRSADRGAARDWICVEMNREIPIPRFAPESLSLLGVGAARLAGRPAAQLGYRRGDQPVTLFVCEASESEFQEMGLIEVAHMVCAIESFAGFKIICWKHRGFLYVLVVPGELDGIVDAIYAAYQS